MNAVYRNDSVRGEGYGILRINDAAPGTSDNPSCTFSLQRSSDGRYLGHADWQDAEEQLVPDAVTPVAGVDGDVELALSPAVVDQLDALEAYRLTVRGEGLPVARCVLELSGIIYSRAVSGTAVAAAPRLVPVQPIQPIQPTPEPQPIPEPVAEPEPPLVLNNNEPAPKKSPVGLIILALLVLALLAGGGWYLLRGNKTVTPEEQTTSAPPPAPEPEKKPETPVLPAETAPTPPAEPKPEPTPPAETKPAPAPPATPAPPVAPTPPPAPLAPKVQVRAFMQSKGTPQQALELARTLPRTASDDQDAVFLLMEMAAEGGVPEAMLETARYYNPADTTPSGSIVKDAEQAFVWYTEAAAKAGTTTDPATVPAVADGLASLREWLRKQAEAGSSEAANLLKKIQ